MRVYLIVFFIIMKQINRKKGDKMYVAVCPELDVVSQGSTVESALDNLKEAAELFIEEM